MSDQQFRNTSPAFHQQGQYNMGAQQPEYVYDEEEEPDSDVDARKFAKKKRRKIRNAEEDDAPPLKVMEYPQQLPPINYAPSPQQTRVSGMPLVAHTPDSTFRDNSPTRLKNGYQQPPTSSSYLPLNQPPSPEKQSSPIKTDRMNTTGGLVRKNTLLNSTNLSDEYQIANYAVAEQFFLKMAYRHKSGNTYEEYSPCATENAELKKYGLGIYLYLQFVKQLAFFFLMMGIVGCINLVYNWMSNALNGYPSSFSLTMVKTTLGNNDRKTQEQVLIQTIISGIISLIVFIFALHWRRFSNKIVDESLEESTDIDSEKYILVFTGMKRQDIDVNKVKRFIEKTYPVYEVSIIYDYKRRFDEMIDLEQLKHEIEAERVTCAAAGQQPKDLPDLQKKFEEKHRQLEESNLTRIPMYLVVHFERMCDMMAYESLFTKRHLIDSLGQKFIRCMTCSQSLPLNYRYEVDEEWLIERLKLGKPEDIIWENMDVGPCQWVLRRIAGILMMLASLFITSSLICMSTLYIATTSSCTTYVPITFAQAQVTSDQNTLFCYCQSEIYAGLTDPAVKSICEGLTSKIIYTNALQIVASLVSVITNVILTFLIGAIVKFMKPKSKSTMFSNMFIFNFIAVLLNSIVLPLLINASIFGTKPVLYVSFLNFFDLAKISMYSDFEKAWYVYIGPYYINIIIISCIMPIIDLVKVAIFACFKRWRLRGKSGKILQKEMNMSIIDYEFDLPMKLSNILVNVFLVMLYAGNMPILLLLEVLALAIAFYCNKTVILKFSARLAANEELNFTMLNIFPFILVFNLAFSIWSFTSDSIFPAVLFDILQLKFFSLPGAWNRALYINFLFAMLALAVLYVVIDYTVVAFFKAVCTCECLRSSSIGAITHEKPYSDRVRNENMVNSYRLGRNPRYAAVSRVIEELFALQKQTQGPYGPLNESAAQQLTV